MKSKNNIYSFVTFFINKKRKYTRLIKVREFFLEKKVIFHFLALSYDFGINEQDISLFKKAITFLFNEIILEIEYYDTEYTKIKSQKIRNQDTLKENWNRLKAELLVENKGVCIEEYFQQIDEIINNTDLLLDFVYQHSVYGVFLKAKDNVQSIFYEDNTLKETSCIDTDLRYEILIKKKQ